MTPVRICSVVVLQPWAEPGDETVAGDRLVGGQVFAEMLAGHCGFGG